MAQQVQYQSVIDWDLSREVSYGQKGVNAYVKYSASGHGSDGSLFLDPYFRPVLEKLNGEKILDIGCGGATWSIYAAERGGDVYAIDIQPDMVSAAQEKVEALGLADRVSVALGDASDLGFASDFFDREISICVTCNLPSGIFEKSFDEISRTLKQGGIAIVGIPNSLDVVFTNGSQSVDEVKEHISSVLSAVPFNPSDEEIRKNLSELTEVLSATFYVREGNLVLLKDETELNEGDKIWRKLPQPIVPNRFHSRKSYAEAFKNSNLRVLSSVFPHFCDEEERRAYNSKAAYSEQLGSEYVSHAPFAIYYITKR